MTNNLPKTEFYDDPLVYDVLHAPGSLEEIDGLQRIADRFVDSSDASKRRWLETACGSGRYLRAGARRGIEIAGFDASRTMIDFARAKQPGVDARVADMRSFATARWRGRFALAFNTINTIRHLDSDPAMLEHLDHVHRCLAPGGAYIVGLSLAHYGHEGPTEDVWTARRGSLRVTQIVQYEPPTRLARSEQVYSHLVIKRPSRIEHRDCSYRLRSYSLGQWKSLLDRSPFEIIACVDERGSDVVAVDGTYRLFVLRARGSRKGVQ